MPGGYATVSAGSYSETHDGTTVAYTFDVGKTYGEAAHKLTVGEMPHITGEIGQFLKWNAQQSQSGVLHTTSTGVQFPSAESQNCIGAIIGISFGNDEYHNNLPPSLVVFRFKRIL